MSAESALLNSRTAPPNGIDLPADAAAAEKRYLVPAYTHLAVEPERGEGVYLWTRDGRRLLDFYGGHAVALLGYGHPRLLARLSGQAAALFFQSNIVPLAVRARAAARLVAFGPEGLTHAFLVNSGAEANENALRLAFRKTGRERVVAVEGAFHGRTAAAAAVTAGSARWYGFPRAPFEVEFVPRGDVAALEQALNRDGGAAALIAEPVQGQAGAFALGAEYLTAARELTRAAGALLILDEIQSGMGRTGQPFAAQTYGVTPDILTTAKGLAGGFPAGAVLVSDEVSSIVKTGDLGTTFGGGPLACALIEAVIETIEEEDLLPRVQVLSRQLRETCPGLGPVTAVQGEGFLLGLRTTRPAKEIVNELIEHGILTGTSGDPNVVRLLPPLILEEAHVHALTAALAELRP
jgi:acetylornithine/succinyldiaminopimelate/putrescine aminotransferase